MKKVILIGLTIVALSSCKKQETQDYKIKFDIIGKSSYSYQVGSVKKSGHCNGYTEVTETAHNGDLIDCTAKSDTIYSIKLEYYRDGREIVGKNEVNPEVKEQL